LKQRLADNISLVAQTSGLDAALVEVAVTVPTFRRPEHLIATLDSIASQSTTRNTAVIVMENDAGGRDGVAAAKPKFDDGTYRGLMVVAHDRGNCSAYNAGWLTALTLFPKLRYIAVIDDDEIADRDWLENLCAAAETHDCAFAGGPQIPVFEGNPHAKWRAHPVFAPQHEHSGPVDMLYSSGNLLVRSDVLRVMPQPFLDTRFNFTGGGDSDFIHRARAKGFATAWTNEAAVRETVPERRVTWGWIQARALRNGMLSAIIEHRMRAEEPLGNVKTVLKSLALLVASPVRFLIRFALTGSLLNSLYPVHVALGRVLSEFGYANEQYRNPEQN
jgi:GT2 family glycosyltransferase